MKPVLHRLIPEAERLAKIDPQVAAKVNDATNRIKEATSDLQELIPIIRTATLSGIADVRKEIITTGITITKGDITDLKAAIMEAKRDYAYKALKTDDHLKLAKSACTGAEIVIRALKKLNDELCAKLLDMAKTQVRT